MFSLYLSLKRSWLPQALTRLICIDKVEEEQFSLKDLPEFLSKGERRLNLNHFRNTQSTPLIPQIYLTIVNFGQQLPGKNRR
jgi:hypothetical protein